MIVILADMCGMVKLIVGILWPCVYLSIDINRVFLRNVEYNKYNHHLLAINQHLVSNENNEIVIYGFLRDDKQKQAFYARRLQSATQ